MVGDDVGYVQTEDGRWWAIGGWVVQADDRFSVCQRCYRDVLMVTDVSGHRRAVNADGSPHPRSCQSQSS